VQGNGSTTGGGSCAYIFTSHLATATGGANNATLRYLFNTFGSDQLITTGTCTDSPGNHVRTCSYYLSRVHTHHREQLFLPGDASAAQVFAQHHVLELELWVCSYLALMSLITLLCYC
jgi:hypothetical protein